LELLKVKNLFISVAILFFVFCTFSACKKKGLNERPTIEIISPAEGASFNSNEAISIKVKVTDDVDVRLIKVGINDENSIAITASQSINVTEKELEKLFVFKLDDPNIKQGSFYISALVSDGEFETKKYLKINIKETPKILMGFITSEANGANSILNFYNTVGTKENSFFYQGVFTKGAFFSSEQLLLSYSLNSGAKAIKWPELNIIWEYNVAPVVNMTIDNDRFFLIKSDHYTTGFNASDFSIYKNYYDPGFVYYPQCAAIGNTVFCAFQMSPNLNAQKKIISYDINTSSVLKEKFTDHIIKDLLTLHDDIYVTYHITSLGEHQIGLYDYANNNFSSIYNLTESVKEILKLDAQNILILNNSGIGILNVPNQSFQMIINQNSINGFAFESIRNEIFIVHNQVVEEYAINGAMIASYNIGYLANSINLMYNK